MNYAALPTKNLLPNKEQRYPLKRAYSKKSLLKEVRMRKGYAHDHVTDKWPKQVNETKVSFQHVLDYEIYRLIDPFTYGSIKLLRHTLTKFSMRG